MAPRIKLIIDTDPGVDDAMAILGAFNARQGVEVIAITTIYGNVPTVLATKNALRLVEIAGQQGKVPVAQGCLRSLKGLEKERIADFVHGPDGFGGVGSQEPEIHAEQGVSAAELIVKLVNAYPGEVTILALAALTNVAQALMLDAELASKWAHLVILGGAFFVNGNVSPAAEANIFGDPDAADFVLAQQPGDRIKILGLDVTQRCKLSAQQLSDLRGAGRFGTFLGEISAFYLEYHRQYLGIDEIYLHDPTALVAVIRPDLFTWHTGAVRVVCDGVARGCTIVDAGAKKWHGGNSWTERSQVQVGLGVNSAEVVALIQQLMTAE